MFAIIWICGFGSTGSVDGADNFAPTGRTAQGHAGADDFTGGTTATFPSNCEENEIGEPD